MRPVRADARRRLAAFATAVAACLAVALAKDPTPSFVPPPGSISDLDLFHRIVVRVGGGDSFYDATQGELRAHGYPTRSVFNWRTPFYAWMMGRVTGTDGARALLMAGALLAVVMACGDLLVDGGLTAAGLGGMTLVGASAWCLGGVTCLFTEVWAGVLIVLSLGAFRRGWALTGVGLGVAAVFYRELALPYAVVSLSLAAWEGRRREALAWALGLAALAAFLAVHAGLVHARLTDADRAIEGGWVRFGGMRFLLATSQTNVFLMPLPLWATAVYLPMSALGLAGQTGGEHGRRMAGTAFAYMAAFCVVGTPYNFYWGFVDAPLLAYGFALAPGALRRHFQEAFPLAPATAAAPRRAPAAS